MIDAGLVSPEPQTQQRLLVPDVINLNGLLYFIAAQIFPANISEVFPASPIPGQGLPNLASSPTPTYKFKVCERVAVMDCIAYGATCHLLTESSVIPPEGLQPEIVV